MSAGYRTLHVGKNGALALAAITVLHGVAVAFRCPYAFAVLRFFLREKTFFIDCNFVTWTVECFYHHSSYSE